ncbi:30S ribosomal protein S1, partial [candidate division KSB1 bacterium]
MSEEVKNEQETQKPETQPEESSTDTPDPVDAVDVKDTEDNVQPALEPGRIVKMEDLIEESDYSDEEQNVLTMLYDQTLNEFSEGEIVKGKILSISDREVAIDIGFKSEGVVPIEEFKVPEDLEVGNEIEIFLDKIEDTEGQLKLSKEKADFTKIWEKVIQYYERGETIEGKISRRIKGGMVVDLTGVDAFLPGSQIDVKPIRDFDALLGKTMEFRIVKVNQLRKNIVVSRRVIIEESLAEQRKNMLIDLEPGQVRIGVVKNITDFGVFIDLGGVDGLLHITDLSWGRVAHPSEIVSFDQKLEVVVLDVDRDKERVSLGLKQLQPHPWENIEEKYPVGKKVKGKVVSITDYGAFVELEKGIEGLIHISEMSWTQHIKHPSKILSIGEAVEAVVLNFDKDEKKISLGLKQIEPDPWTDVIKKYPIGTKHSGKVRNVTNFGVFVELEEGVDGLVHISDLSWTKKIRHPSEVVKKSDSLDVVILNVSEDDRRISLGHKQLEDNPWDTFEMEFKKGVTTTGKVIRTVEKGVVVELPGGVEGFVPASHLNDSKDEKKEKKSFNTGDELSIKVIEFDKENKKIVLSYSELIKDAESKEVKEFLEKQQEEKSVVTIEDTLIEAGIKDDAATEAKEEEPADTPDVEPEKEAVKDSAAAEEEEKTVSEKTDEKIT